MAQAAAVAGSEVLRVATVWGTTVVAMKNLARGESFDMGEDKATALPIPEGLSYSPLRAAASGGWNLDVSGAVAGALHLRGRDEDPASVARVGAPIGVLPGDYGLLQYGLFSVFFQYTTQTLLPAKGSRVELLALLALMSSGMLHVGGLGLVRTLMTPPPLDKPLELTSYDDYAARFGLHRATIDPPPPPVAGVKAADSGVKDPGAKDPKPKGGGRRIDGEEGKASVNGKREHTELPGELKPARHLGGLSDVLASDTGAEIKRSLADGGTVAEAVSGLNSATLVRGEGTGTSLISGGPGSGGTGFGTPFASGTLDTGSGPGIGGGHGPGTGKTGNGGAVGATEHRIVAGELPIRRPNGLSPDQVQRIVQRHVGALRTCYDIEVQKNPQLRGGVTATWQIDASGAVTSAGLVGTTLNNPRIEGCITRQVRRWQFPASEAPTIVAGYPFRFGVGE